MSSGLIRFLKSLVKQLGEAALASFVQQHAVDNRLSVQQHRDLVDELESVGISVEQPVDAAAKRAIEDEAAEPKHDAADAARTENAVVEGASQVAVVDSQGVVQKVIEVQGGEPGVTAVAAK